MIDEKYRNGTGRLLSIVKSDLFFRKFAYWYLRRRQSIPWNLYAMDISKIKELTREKG